MWETSWGNGAMFPPASFEVTLTQRRVWTCACENRSYIRCVWLDEPYAKQ